VAHRRPGTTPTARHHSGGRSGPLLRWFRSVRRDLPWRADRDPYRIWVAEVLLQQTRVAQAAPYFRRFVTRFPSVHALARARLGSVLKVWEGAGYYARARHLHAAARTIVREHGGELPGTAAELARLPGFGPYISAAVASLAFGERVPALEANGIRVLARWHLEEGDPRSPAVRRRLTERLAAELPGADPGAFNEALMELGETICLPRAPRCPACPVAAGCAARQRLPDPGAIPRRSAPRKKPLVHAAVVALRRDGRWLVQRRPPGGLLGGLWEFPGGKVERLESPREAAMREVAEETGLQLRQVRARGRLRHAYSHFAVELHLFEADVPPGAAVRLPARTPHRWATRAEFARLPRPRATIRALARLTDPASPLPPPTARARRSLPSRRPFPVSEPSSSAK
jgi:A/G-specific adenine glycosylase